jgi:hypothetical protein
MRPNRQIERKRKGRLGFLFGFLGCSYFRSDGWGLIYLRLLTDEIVSANSPGAGWRAAQKKLGRETKKCSLPEFGVLNRD